MAKTCCISGAGEVPGYLFRALTHFDEGPRTCGRTSSNNSCINQEVGGEVAFVLFPTTRARRFCTCAGMRHHCHLVSRCCPGSHRTPHTGYACYEPSPNASSPPFRCRGLSPLSHFTENWLSITEKFSLHSRSDRFDRTAPRSLSPPRSLPTSPPPPQNGGSRTRNGCPATCSGGASARR